MKINLGIVRLNTLKVYSLVEGEFKLVEATRGYWLKRAFTGGFAQLSELLQLKLSGLRSNEGMSDRHIPK